MATVTRGVTLLTLSPNTDMLKEMSTPRSPRPVEQPIRFIVRHHHRPDPSLPREEVLIGYHNDLPEAFSYAVSTASRYHGVIYAEYPSEGYVFVRSYSEGRQDREQAA